MGPEQGLPRKGQLPVRLEDAMGAKEKVEKFAVITPDGSGLSSVHLFYSELFLVGLKNKENRCLLARTSITLHFFQDMAEGRQ